MKRSFIAYAVSLVALSASLAGCNGGGDPTPSPTVTSSSPGASPSVSASPSPSPSPLVSIPAEAMQQTPEGAVAFVKFYFNQVDLAWTSGAPGPLADLAAPECGTCANFLSTAQQFEKSATHADGPSFEVDNVKVTPGAPEGRIFLSSTIRQLPSRVVDVSGQVLSQATPDEIAADIALTWTGASWRTYAVSF